MKTIPPTISCFQEIIKIINKNKAGILCTNKPTAIWLAVDSGSKISSENNIKKIMNIIDNILGAQYKYLLA